MRATCLKWKVPEDMTLRNRFSTTMYLTGSTSGHKIPDQLRDYKLFKKEEFWDIIAYSAVKVNRAELCLLPASWIRFHLKFAVRDVSWISGLRRRVVSLIGTNVSEKPTAYPEYGGSINQTTQQ
jgi:hypothetical protein